MCDVGVVREQDGVVGHHGVAGGQDATGHVVHHVQNTVVHQEVIDQQLHAHKHAQITAELLNIEPAATVSVHTERDANRFQSSTFLIPEKNFIFILRIVTENKNIVIQRDRKSNKLPCVFCLLR